MNAPAASAPAASAKGSLRMVFLLVVLAIMLGALGYDKLYAGPSKDKAKDDIDAANGKKSAEPVDLTKDMASMKFTNKDVREIIGFAPKWTKKVEGETWECYAWWGPIPLNRNYLIVRYHGEQNLVYRDCLDGEMPKKDPPPPVSKGVPPTTGGMPMGMGMGGRGPGKGAPPESDEAATKDSDDEKKSETTEKPKDPADEDAPSEASEKPVEKPKADEP